MCVYHQSAYADNCNDAVDQLLIFLSCEASTPEHKHDTILDNCSGVDVFYSVYRNTETVSCCDPGRACPVLQHKFGKHLYCVAIIDKRDLITT